MSTGVKETIQLLDAIDKLLVAIEVAHDDGKIDLMDLPKLLPLWHDFYDAAQGLKDIPAELKDLDAAEVQQLAQKSVDIFVQMARMALGTRAA